VFVGLFTLLLASLHGGNQSIRSSSGPLSLSVTPIISIRDGPVLLLAELHNTGKHSVTLYKNVNQRSCLHVAQADLPFLDIRPDAWAVESRSSTKDSPPTESLLRSGEKTAEIVFLHSPIGARQSSSSVIISWDQPYRIDDPSVATPKIRPALGPSVKYRLVAAEPNSLTWAMLGAYAADFMFSRNVSADERVAAWTWISSFPRPEYAQLAFRFLDYCPTYGTDAECAKYIYRCHRNDSLANDYVVAELKKGGQHGLSLFALWAKGVVSKPNREQIALLDRSSSVWVRALTCSTFSGQTSATVNNVANDIKSWLAHPASAQVSEMIAKLDSPGYRDRERAYAALLRQGDEAEMAALSHLSRPISAELRRRLEALVAQIPRSEHPSESMRFVRVANRIGGDRSLEFVKVLSQGSQSFSASLEANRLLKETGK
jgi:hypothetical protein